MLGALREGAFQFAGAFFGWFLAAYSCLRYAIQAIGLAFRGGIPLWGTFIPINFSLTLIGFSVFGIHNRDAIQIAIGIFTGFIVLGIFLSMTSYLWHRFIPLVLLLILSFPFYERLSPIWTQIFLAVAAVALMMGLIEFTKSRRAMAKSDQCNG